MLIAATSLCALGISLINFHGPYVGSSKLNQFLRVFGPPPCFFHITYLSLSLRCASVTAPSSFSLLSFAIKSKAVTRFHAIVLTDNVALLLILSMGGEAPMRAKPTMKGCWILGDNLKGPWVAKITLLGR